MDLVAPRAVPPDADVPVAAFLGEIHPRLPVIFGVVHGFVGRSQPLRLAADHAPVDGIMAPVVHPQHGASLFKESVAVFGKHAGVVKVSANTVVQNHQVNPKLGRARSRPAKNAVQPHFVPGFNAYQVYQH